ncbi:chemotaxis protein CheW [Erythrobacter longus]|uniref:Chemotaxis protein CheW n=1 Tax=Erythrobacter longus TaxID=1044 RepID=A0A074M656_ERYLO|nr:chemotaxis protein CheW [Erythrobacter longus]KEO90206.1 chemotaxis protein CheW [Erythrobacter longus]
MNSLLVMALIAGRRCAFLAPEVQSVIEIAAVTPIPRTPSYITGLTALRSQALTVLDCRTAMGFDADNFATDHRAIVASFHGDAYALRVDAIEDICTAMSEPASVPGGFGKRWSRVSKGLIETRVGPALLLNLEKIVDGHAANDMAA